MQRKIVVNGREYDLPAAMPPEDRRLYDQALARLGPDRDGNGIPDRMEGAGLDSERTVIEHSIVVNQQTFRSVEEMPPEVRRACDQATGTAPSGPMVSVQLRFPGALVLVAVVAAAVVFAWVLLQG